MQCQSIQSNSKLFILLTLDSHRIISMQVQINSSKGTNSTRASKSSEAFTLWYHTENILQGAAQTWLAKIYCKPPSSGCTSRAESAKRMRANTQLTHRGDLRKERSKSLEVGFVRNPIPRLLCKESLLSTSALHKSELLQLYTVMFRNILVELTTEAHNSLSPASIITAYL